MTYAILVVFFFQAEDGIRYLVRSRGLGDVYKRQRRKRKRGIISFASRAAPARSCHRIRHTMANQPTACLLYTSDAADERSSVDLGGRRIIKKKKKQGHTAERCDAHSTRKNVTKYHRHTARSDGKRCQ